MVTFALCLYQWDPVCPDVINGIIVTPGKNILVLYPYTGNGVSWDPLSQIVKVLTGIKNVPCCCLHLILFISVAHNFGWSFPTPGAEINLSWYSRLRLLLILKCQLEAQWFLKQTILLFHSLQNLRNKNNVCKQWCLLLDSMMLSAAIASFSVWLW